MAPRYQIVCMVVDCGSLKGAADELGYTQSAVSQAVKALERELGTTLIERGKQGVSLTRDGKQYLPYLRQIVTAEAELEGKRQELRGRDTVHGEVAQAGLERREVAAEGRVEHGIEAERRDVADDGQHFVAGDALLPAAIEG